MISFALNIYRRFCLLMAAIFLLGAPICAGQQIIHVPSEQPNLAAAINAVSDGGVIEVAGGTYMSPSGGYTVFDLPAPKGFTVRAAPGAAVVFSGGGSTDILKIAPSNLTKLNQINFEFITFADGIVHDNFVGGGLTLVNAKAVFRSCTFQNNSARGSGTGGGALWIAGSLVSFNDCTWTDNTSPNFGGGMSITGSRVFIRNSRFTGNRVDVPNHKTNAAGGAIYIGDGTVRISNCSFDNNRAGYVGGAIDTNGSWKDPLSTPSVDIVIRDSSFTGNRAQFDPSVGVTAPAVGGAAHFEGQTTAKFYNCRFTNNTARQGGAISNYLAITEFNGCLFKGNQATGTGDEGGQGGTVIALSSETGVNHRSIQLLMTDCLIEGSGPGVKSARQGGCIYAGGDMNFAYGVGGASQNGTEQSNRGSVVLTRVAMVNAAAIGDAGTPGGLPGVGGAFLGTFVDLTMTDSIIANCETTNSGAGIQMVDGSVGNVTRSTIARCISGEQGTGVTLYGASLNVTDSKIINNTINGTGKGVAITSAPNVAFGGLPAFEINGAITNCLFAGNSGQSTVLEGDRDTPPFNRMQYNGNTFFPTGTAFYSDYVGPPKTVAELNSLVITHGDRTQVDKSTSDNFTGDSKSVSGQILTLPPTVLTAGAPGETVPIPSYIVYAATAPPTIDGLAQRTDTGIIPTSTDGAHTLTVGGTSFATPPSPKGFAANISTRLPVGSGQDVLIGGFIIQGNNPKRVMIRAIGPSLNGFLTGALQDPYLELHDGTGALIATNDNWQSTQLGAFVTSDQSLDIEGSGIAPGNNNESAIIASLTPGAYTAVVRGANNAAGIAVVEAYDLDPIQTSTLANIATRGFVQTGQNVMIGGFIYLGGVGETNVVIRAIGPSLGPLGITNPLADPILELHDGNGATVASNDNWTSSPDAATIQRLGLQPSNDAESAIYRNGLARGAYTAIVRGQNGGAGVGVVEVYIF